MLYTRPLSFYLFVPNESFYFNFPIKNSNSVIFRISNE